MAYQLSELVTDVQNRLDDSSFDTSLLKQFLNDAQRDVFNQRYFRFMETSQNYTLQTSTADITNGAGLPSNFQVPTMVQLTQADKEDTLKFINHEDFIRRYPGNAGDADAKPYFWYEYGGTINVYPTPDQTYTATLYYFKRPTELSANADVPEIPEEFQEILTLGALKRAHEFNDDYDLAVVVQTKIDELLTDMTRRFSTRQAHGPAMMRVNKTRRV